jgi:hypothetical protein
MWPGQWEITDKRKWLVLAIAIKALLFGYFALEFKTNWPDRDIQSGIVVFYQDSYTYYTPIEEWVDKGVYRGACRMPGLLPLYAPFYAVLGPIKARVVMILLQLLLDAIATCCLALLAYRFFESKRIAHWTFSIAAISSFTSVWNNYAVSDSFAVSMLVFAFYTMHQFGQKRQFRFLFLSALWIAWSIFFRPIHLLALPILGIYVLYILQPFKTKNFEFIKVGFIWLLPLTLAIGLWTFRNWKAFDKIIPLQEDPSICYYNLQDFHLAVRDNVVAWGCDFQEWSLNTEFAWLLDSSDQSLPKVPQRIYTTAMNADSLMLLKANYHMALQADRQNLSDLPSKSQLVIEQARRFLAAYKAEHAWDYYFVNRLRLLKLFLFPGRLDNLPLPARADMNVFQFAIKLFYLLLLSVVILFGVLSFGLLFIKKHRDVLILLAFPLTHIVVLGVYLGYAEQRYLTPAYPFLIILTAAGMSIGYDTIKSKWTSKRTL